MNEECEGMWGVLFPATATRLAFVSNQYYPFLSKPSKQQAVCATVSKTPARDTAANTAVISANQQHRRITGARPLP